MINGRSYQAVRSHTHISSGVIIPQCAYSISEVNTMSSCCASSCSSGYRPAKHHCPVNGREYKEVSATTILHHINSPWAWSNAAQAYYFCDDPDCNVVYFGQDDSVIEKSGLRTPVGKKEKSPGALVCYCFGVTEHEAIENPEIRAFVQQKTKEHACACETRNPSGKCCLKDFPES